MTAAQLHDYVVSPNSVDGKDVISIQEILTELKTFQHLQITDYLDDFVKGVFIHCSELISVEVCLKFDGKVKVELTSTYTEEDHGASAT